MVTSPVTELDWTSKWVLTKSSATSPETVLMRARGISLLCTVTEPETELILASPTRSAHSVAPLTVLIVLRPCTSLIVISPDTVLAARPRRSP